MAGKVFIDASVNDNGIFIEGSAADTIKAGADTLTVAAVSTLVAMATTSSLFRQRRSKSLVTSLTVVPVTNLLQTLLSTMAAEFMDNIDDVLTNETSVLVLPMATQLGPQLRSQK